MVPPGASDPVELDPARVEARVDQILHDNEAIPTLVIVDGAVVVEMAALDPVAAREAATTIAAAAMDLAEQLARIRPSWGG